MYFERAKARIEEALAKLAPARSLTDAIADDTDGVTELLQQASLI